MPYLKAIKSQDLVLGQNDTKYILSVFSPATANTIKNSNMDNNMRALAQGLLIEASRASKNVNAIKEVGEFLLTRNPTKPIKLMTALEESAKVIYNYNQDTEFSAEILKDAGFSKEVIGAMRLKWGREIERVIEGVGLSYLAENNLSNNISHLTSIGINDPADNHQANDVMQFFTEYTSTERYKNFETAENKHEAVILGEIQKEQVAENEKQALLNSDYYTKPNQFGLTQAFLDEANRQSQEALLMTKGRSV